MAVRLLIIFVFAAGFITAATVALVAARRRSSPVKALPPADRRYYGIAQDAARLLERLVDDDADLPMFSRDDDRERAHDIIERFYKR